MRLAEKNQPPAAPEKPNKVAALKDRPKLPAAPARLPPAVAQGAENAIVDAPPKTKREEPQRVEVNNNRLSEEDIVLLKTSGRNYYFDSQIINPERPEQYAEVIGTKALITVSGARANLARMSLFQDELTVCLSALIQAKNEQLSHVREMIFSAGFADALKATLDGKTPSFAEYLAQRHSQPGLSYGVRWIESARIKLILINLFKIAIYETQAEIAREVTALVATRHGAADLSADGSLSLLPLDHDEVNEAEAKRVNKGRSRHDPILVPLLSYYFVKLKYEGDRPLTNVVAVGHLETTGATEDFTPEEWSALSLNRGLNQATGFGDQNEDILTLLRSHRHLDSMPRSGLVYIPEIRSGDVVHVPLGEPKERWLEHGTLALFCDQGYVPQSKFTFPKPKNKSTSRKSKSKSRRN